MGGRAWVWVCQGVEEQQGNLPASLFYEGVTKITPGVGPGIGNGRLHIVRQFKPYNVSPTLSTQGQRDLADCGC